MLVTVARYLWLRYSGSTKAINQIPGCELSAVRKQWEWRQLLHSLTTTLSMSMIFQQEVMDMFKTYRKTIRQDEAAWDKFEWT